MLRSRQLPEVGNEAGPLCLGSTCAPPECPGELLMKWAKYRKSLHKIVRRVRCRLQGGHRILVLGDSHAGVFEYMFDRDLLLPHLVNCDLVGGATAYGLNNDRSATGAFAVFLRALRRYAAYDVVVIMLGEVDCSFALLKKAERQGVSPESLIEQSLSGLRRLVFAARDERASPVRRVILAGSILPTVDDQSAPRQVNELRREVRVSQAERTRLVLRFNEEVRKMAEELGVRYIDLTAHTLHPATGLVDHRCIDSPQDHHLAHAASAPLWARELLKIL